MLAAVGFGHVPIPLLHGKNEFDGMDIDLKIIPQNFDTKSFRKQHDLNKPKSYLIGNTGKIWDIRKGFHTLMKEYQIQHENEKLYKYFHCDEVNDKFCKFKWTLFQTECCKFIITIR